MMRYLHPFLVQLLKMSVTGDTAKILVSNSAEVVHFHLKTQSTQTSYTLQNVLRKGED